MASSAGSAVFAVLVLLTISLIVLLLLRYYLPLRSSPAFLTVPIFLSIALPSSAILLVPIDLASSERFADEGSKGIWLPERMVLISWRITYWLTFVLTWAVLPFLGDFMDAGYRDSKSRMTYSLRSNGRYQLIVLSCAILGLIYIIFSYGFDYTAIKTLLMALAYVWGLMLAIYLMGHGLVAVPRRMFRNASISGRLRRIQSQAPKIHEKLEDSCIDLEDIEGQIGQLKQRKSGTARDFQQWIDDLADLVGTAPLRSTLATPELESSTKVPAVITERYLADLTRRFNRARHRRARYLTEWDRVVQTASDLQAILDSKASKRLSFGRSSPHTSWISRYSPLTPYLRYHVHVNILPALRLVTGSILSLASVAIIWSEIIRFPAPELSAVSLTVIHHPSSKTYQIGLGGQFLAALWICYMCACAFSSVTDVPVWNQRALVPRLTHAESACWYAGQAAKLTVPLAYNFLTFLPKDIHQNTTFYQFLGRLINLTPLGTWFEKLFPIFILLPVCATLFNLYGKVKDVLGFGILEDEDDESNPSGFGTGGWREGRDLIARDLDGSSRPHNSASLGLTSSPRQSLEVPTNREPRWAPSSGEALNSGGVPRTGLRNQAPTTRGPPPLDPEPDEENFFTLFGRRVKNTFEQIETPTWMQGDQSSTNPGFKRPKWMGGDDDGAGGSESNVFDRLFGGSSRTKSSAGDENRSGPGIGSGRIML